MRQAAQQQFDIDELRTQLSQQLRSNAAFSETVYQEQPILMTGRQLRSFVPDAIREARQLTRRSDLRYESSAKVFYEQARFLAGYEDDFEFTGTFHHYFPTYEIMSNEELRGYFSWRTKVRRGQIERGQLSFAYLYLYELINLVGVSDAHEGYEAMHAFGDEYTRLEPSFKRYFNAWADDFVIYYQLDPSLLRTLRFAPQDNAYEVLTHRNEHTDDELFFAILTFNSYPLEESPFFLDHERELKALVVHAYKVAADHHDAKLKTSLADKLFGRMSHEPYQMFSNAVFADPLKIRRLDYEISPLDTVYCRERMWWRARYASLEVPCPWISKLVMTAESILRDAYEFPNTLDQPITTKYIVKEIVSLADDFVAQRRAAQARAVHIDMSKLGHIRIAAESTCDKLIVEEDEIEALAQPQAHAEAIQKEPTAHQEPCAGEDAGACPLAPDERALVLAIMSGASVHDFERENACIASVLIDSINEKLYDEFADICIETSGDEPELIEDYISDLKELLAA